MKAYCSAVSEITIDSITAKKFDRLPLDSVKTRITNNEPTPAEAGAALDGEGRTQLGADQAAGDHVQHDDEAHPEQRLAAAVGGRRGDRVERDEGRDRKADQVETAQHLAELDTLLRHGGGALRGGVDYGRGHLIPPVVARRATPRLEVTVSRLTWARLRFRDRRLTQARSSLRGLGDQRLGAVDRHA